ncbi:CU044_2847 family protein [Streptomyces sp. 8N616]|uniref:CU044_2847 family protein n=1 Tax=Streptomyces sp. 8N616 TaxID=3457414 RepID=UPI003FD360F1
MTHYAEMLLADDTSVRLELAPVGIPPEPGVAQAVGARPAGPPAPADTAGQDLPDGIAGAVPAGRRSEAAAVLATDTMRSALRPLGPLLQQVHDSVATAADPPQEISVQFGVHIGQDFKLGIVGANGQASMTISATWRLPSATDAARTD